MGETYNYLKCCWVENVRCKLYYICIHINKLKKQLFLRLFGKLFRTIKIAWFLKLLEQGHKHKYLLLICSLNRQEHTD